MCGNIESTSHYLFDCVQFSEQRKFMLESIAKILPNFVAKPKYKKTEILLKGINLDQTEPDHRNKQITFVVQNYILKTGRFSEKYFALERAQPQPNCPFVGIATRSPPLWLVLVSPFPKWLRACCGWGDAGVAWSRVRLNFCTQR